MSQLSRLVMCCSSNSWPIVAVLSDEDIPIRSMHEDNAWMMSSNDVISGLISGCMFRAFVDKQIPVCPCMPSCSPLEALLGSSLAYCPNGVILNPFLVHYLPTSVDLRFFCVQSGLCNPLEIPHLSICGILSF